MIHGAGTVVHMLYVDAYTHPSKFGLVRMHSVRELLDEHYRRMCFRVLMCPDSAILIGADKGAISN